MANDDNNNGQQNMAFNKEVHKVEREPEGQKMFMRKRVETKQPRRDVAMVVKHGIDPETGEEVRDTTYHRLQSVSPDTIFENEEERARRMKEKKEAEEERRRRQTEKPTRELSKQIAVEKKEVAKDGSKSRKQPYSIFDIARMAK